MLDNGGRALCWQVDGSIVLSAFLADLLPVKSHACLPPQRYQ